jgi:hypothetical protein
LQSLWRLLNNQQYKKLKILSGYCLGIIIFIFAGQYYICPIKYFFKIPCPGCGMTRAFIRILHFDFTGALKYNILSIPVFIWFVLFFVLIIYDLIFSTEYLEKFLHIKLTFYHYTILAIIMFISWFINIKRGI